MSTPDWTPEGGAMFEEATALRDKNQLEAARLKAKAALAHLLPVQTRARTTVLREIGFTYYLEEDYDGALPWFTAARDALPTSELSSLATFHCLFDLGRLDEALAEALRYCSQAYSKEYQSLFETAFRDDVPSHLIAIADRVRAELRAPPDPRLPDRG